MNIPVTTNSLWRTTVNQKKQARYYSIHGQGRDGYIINATPSWEGLNAGATFRISSTPSEKQVLHQDKIVKYSSDGKGRDTYIMCNSGGIYSQDSSGIGVDKKKIFIESLRSFRKVNSCSNFVKVMPKDILTAQRQKQLSNNLSQPKTYQNQINLELYKKLRMSNFNNFSKSPDQLKIGGGSFTPKEFSPEFKRSFQNQAFKYTEADQYGQSPRINLSRFPTLSHQGSTKNLEMPLSVR